MYPYSNPQPGFVGPPGRGHSFSNPQPGFVGPPGRGNSFSIPQPGFVGPPGAGYSTPPGFALPPVGPPVQITGASYPVGDFGRKRLRGAELLSAREQVQLDIFRDTFWCCYSYFCGLGCLPSIKQGLCLSIGQVCCCAGTTRSALPYDEDGCTALTTKFCCLVWHCEIPPSQTPGCGCWRLMCCGNLNSIGRDPFSMSATEREEHELLRNTCWCPFLYCCGIGCNPPTGNEPCCKIEGKFCCLWSNLETDDSFEEAISSTQKCCCLISDCSCPAGRTPGCGCCNILCGGNLYAGPMQQESISMEPRY